MNVRDVLTDIWTFVSKIMQKPILTSRIHFQDIGERAFGHSHHLELWGWVPRERSAEEVRQNSDVNLQSLIWTVSTCRIMLYIYIYKYIEGEFKDIFVASLA